MLGFRNKGKRFGISARWRYLHPFKTVCFLRCVYDFSGHNNLVCFLVVLMILLKKNEYLEYVLYYTYLIEFVGTYKLASGYQ